MEDTTAIPLKHLAKRGIRIPPDLEGRPRYETTLWITPPMSPQQVNELRGHPVPVRSIDGIVDRKAKTFTVKKSDAKLLFGRR